MWPGPCSLCQPRTGGQPQLVGIPHIREQRGNETSEARERGGGRWCVGGVKSTSEKQPGRQDEALRRFFFY